MNERSNKAEGTGSASSQDAHPLLLLNMHLAPGPGPVVVLLMDAYTITTEHEQHEHVYFVVDAREGSRGVGERGRELVLEATAMDRADFVRVAAGAASTLVATSLSKESLASDVAGAYLAVRRKLVAPHR